MVMVGSASLTIIEQVEELHKIPKEKLCIIYADGIDCETNFKVEELNKNCRFLKEVNPNGNPTSSWQCKDYRVEALKLF